MTSKSQTIVLNTHNGRNTQYIEDIPGTSSPVFHWLLFGYVENFDIWLDVPMSANEVEDFVNNLPTLYDGYLAELSPRVLRLRLLNGNERVMELNYRTGRTDTPSLAALRVLRDELLTDTQVDRTFADNVVAYLNGNT